MKLLLVGCGRWGQNWAKTLHSLDALGAICDPRTELHSEFQTKWPGVTCYADLTQALADRSIEGCVIATPAPTHVDTAEQCLKAGKGLMVEKPLTLNVADAEKLLAKAEQAKQVVAVGHVLMHHPAYQTLMRLIKEGELGDILSVQCTRTNLGTIRNEENIWWSFAPHDISLITMIYGDQPLTVTGVSPLTVLQRPTLQDSVYVSMTTPTLQQASIHVSWYAAEKRHETVVIGSEKMAIVNDTAPAEEKLCILDYDIEMDGDTVHSVKRGERHFVPLDSDEPPLTREARTFMEALKANSGRGLPNNGLNGLAVVRVLEQVQQQLDAQSPAQQQPAPALI